MKRNNAEQIGELIRNYLRQESLESPLNERRLISAWPEVLGPTMASYTLSLIHIFLLNRKVLESLFLSQNFHTPLLYKLNHEW